MLFCWYSARTRIPQPFQAQFRLAFRLTRLSQASSNRPISLRPPTMAPLHSLDPVLTLYKPYKLDDFLLPDNFNRYQVNKGHNPFYIYPPAVSELIFIQLHRSNYTSTEIETTTMDYPYNEKSSNSIFGFRDNKTNPSVPAYDDPAPAPTYHTKFALMSFHMTNRIRLLRFNVDEANAVQSVIQTKWSALVESF